MLPMVTPGMSGELGKVRPSWYNVEEVPLVSKQVKKVVFYELKLLGQNVKVVALLAM